MPKHGVYFRYDPTTIGVYFRYVWVCTLSTPRGFRYVLRGFRYADVPSALVAVGLRRGPRYTDIQIPRFGNFEFKQTMVDNSRFSPHQIGV